MKSGLIILSMFLILSSCKNEPSIPPKLHTLLAVTYQQTAGEVIALQYQAYQVAYNSLKNQLKDRKGGKPAAVVLDLDETVLDNSPYQARQLKTGESFPAGWKEWVEERQAKAIPGAVPFLRKADSMGVRLFYISNRKQDELTATRDNMIRLGIPQTDSSNFLLRRAESGKESRRKMVSENYEILLLIGDNLSDFDEGFDKKSVSERNKRVHDLAGKFGTTFIQLPNPLYGDWESAMFNHDYSLSDSARLRSYYNHLNMGH